MPYVVALTDQGVTWGPFADEDEARDFAEFVTAEVDPAEVRVLCRPATELLNWRRAMAALRDGED